MNENLYRVHYSLFPTWIARFEMGEYQFEKMISAEFECVAEVYAESLEAAQDRVEYGASIGFGWVRLPVDDSEDNRVQRAQVFIDGKEYAEMGGMDYDMDAIRLMRWLEAAENARLFSLDLTIYNRGDHDEDHIVNYEGVNA